MQSTRDKKERAAPLSLLDLAPGGGCLAVHIAVNAGGLLHRLFTIAACAAVCFCGPSDRLLHPGVSPAPRPVECGLSSSVHEHDRDHPTNLRRFHHTRKEDRSQHHLSLNS